MDAEGHVMADERYQWLDQEAAERLLRGEPVDPVDDASRAQAEILARALAAARTPMAAASDGELPGEAAALAAFRKAVAERAADAVLPGPAGRAPTDLGAVRLVPVHGGRRWGRSLRYGLAAAFAAVTVGGVAVAAGTGVLPLTAEPAPGGSVTTVDTGTPAASGSPTAGTGVPAVPTGPGVRTTTPGATGGPTTATAGPGGKDGATATPGGTPSESPRTRDEERLKVVKACQDFRSGKLSGSGRDRLVNALRNGETVKRYCDRILSGVPATATTRPTSGRTPSGGGSGSGGSGGGADSGSSDGDDKSDRGGKDHDRDKGRGHADRDRGQGSQAPGKHGTDRSRS
ncbi:hypothetical protein ACGF1Z_16780 [Streptomyces sp. NPDC048018]|uniref:hypothetical protein n=1 Tax=Streptomyces sp. NPDC048018 TaxID=3365499 RepID=UPI0037229000